jgi:hypothetical protein
MWSRRRLIQIISDAEPANSADSVQTLLKGYKAAIRGTTGGPSIFRTPGIVLGLSGFFDEENGYENSHNEQQNPHGHLPLARAENASPMVLFLVIACVAAVPTTCSGEMP